MDGSRTRSAPPTQVVAEPRIELSHNRCPFCHTHVEVETPDGLACRRCLARHHRACWEESGSCAACGDGAALSLDPRLSRRPSPPRPPRRSGSRRRAYFTRTLLPVGTLLALLLGMSYVTRTPAPPPRAAVASQPPRPRVAPDWVFERLDFLENEGHWHGAIDLARQAYAETPDPELRERLARYRAELRTP